MEDAKKRPVVSALLIGWATFYLLYALLGVWMGTGKDALAGPSTTGDNIFAVAWLGCAVLQLVAAVALHRQYKRWLFWTAIALAALSVSMVFGPLLLSPLFGS